MKKFEIDVEAVLNTIVSMDAELVAFNYGNFYDHLDTENINDYPSYNNTCGTRACICGHAVIANNERMTHDTALRFTNDWITETLKLWCPQFKTEVETLRKEKGFLLSLYSDSEDYSKSFIRAYSFVNELSIAGLLFAKKDASGQMKEYSDFVKTLRNDKCYSAYSNEEAIKILLLFMKGFATEECYTELIAAWQEYKEYGKEVKLGYLAEAA